MSQLWASARAEAPRVIVNPITDALAVATPVVICSTDHYDPSSGYCNMLERLTTFADCVSCSWAEKVEMHWEPKGKRRLRLIADDGATQRWRKDDAHE